MPTYTGTDGNDTVTGSANRKNVFNDFGVGSDDLTGGSKDDVFHLAVDLWKDTVDGGAGIDTVDYSGADRALTIDLKNGYTTGTYSVDVGLINLPLPRIVTELANIENVVGTRFNDTIIGDDNNNVIEGGGGADTIHGGAGSDTASYRNSAEGVHVDLSGVSLFGHLLDIGYGRGGDAEGDILTGIENLVGSDYDDTFVGSRYDNVFTGGNGEDTFVFRGHIGHDTITDFDARGNVHDVIQLSRDLLGDFDSFAEFKEEYLYRDGDDVEIRIGDHNSITLQGVSLRDLDSSDFVFV